MLFRSKADRLKEIADRTGNKDLWLDALVLYRAAKKIRNDRYTVEMEEELKNRFRAA